MDIAVYFKGYKNFSDKNLVGFDNFRPMNVLIGKNNIGKSSFLNSIKFLIDSRQRENYKNIVVSFIPDRETIERFFPKNTSGGGIGGNHLNFGLGFVNTQLDIILGPKIQLSLSQVMEIL